MDVIHSNKIVFLGNYYGISVFRGECPKCKAIIDVNLCDSIQCACGYVWKLQCNIIGEKIN